jgi:hypothetical protein
MEEAAGVVVLVLRKGKQQTYKVKVNWLEFSSSESVSSRAVRHGHGER